MEVFDAAEGDVVGRVVDDPGTGSHHVVGLLRIGGKEVEQAFEEDGVEGDPERPDPAVLFFFVDEGENKLSHSAEEA